MGLAAGQARLLSITGRKSDCEFQSMRISHQKIALSRQLADISNEYQNSLNQTKLVYDYYGTGDTSTQLSYNLMMKPSALNDYMPITVSDSAGRIVLDSKLAAAAAAAGIPHEGLGTLPSEVMRNNFLAGLLGVDLITEDLYGRISSLPYNQKAGFGGGETVAVQTKEITGIDELAKYLTSTVNPVTDSSYASDITNGIAIYNDQGDTKEVYYKGEFPSNGWSGFANGYTPATNDNIKLGDILTGDVTLIGIANGNMCSSIGYSGGAIDAVVTSGVWKDMFAAIEDLLGVDEFSKQALEYARSNIEYLISNQCDPNNKSIKRAETGAKDGKRQFHNDTDMKNFAIWTGVNKLSDSDVISKTQDFLHTNKYIGLVSVGNTDSGHDDKNGCKATVGVSLTNVMKAYLTYFADYINGIAKTKSDGSQLYEVNKSELDSKLVNKETAFTIKIGKEISSSDLGIATFYDALFNQICANGWTKDNNITDNTYLQQMLQNGMMFVSRVNEDGYYYQGNYATDSYIKEIPDESAIAFAEAKYNTEKAKLNSKEETLDLKMKNLDTEISSLTTEYDTVKNTISKQIEKCFKRFTA